MDKLNFQASSNPIKAIIDIGHNKRMIKKEFLGQRKSKILTLFWILIAAFFLIMIIGILSSGELYGIYMLLILFAFVILALALYLFVFLRVRRSSPVFNVRAIYFSSNEGFELEYRNNTREFVAYKNVSELILKSNFDKQIGQAALAPVSLLAWTFLSPKAAEWSVSNHFSLIIKEGENKKEISIPFDISRVYEAIKLIKDNSNIETPDIQGAPITSFSTKPLSPKNILIASIVIIVVISILVGVPAYLELKSAKHSVSELPKSTITEDKSTEIEISNWETYKNEEYNFSFNFPKDFEVKGPEGTPEEAPVSFGIQPVEEPDRFALYPISISLYNASRITFAELLNNYNITYSNGQYLKNGIILEKINIGKQKAIIFEEKLGWIGPDYKDREAALYDRIIFQKGNYTYLIQGIEDFKSIFNQLLSTFRFLE